MPQFCRNVKLAKTNSSAIASFCKNRRSNSSERENRFFGVLDVFFMQNGHLNDQSE